MLAPQHARELLHILEAAGLLRVTTLLPSLASAGASGTRDVLAACFAAPPATGSGHGRAGQVQEGGAGAGAGPASEDGEEDASDSEAAGGQQQRQGSQRSKRFYFVLPGACFSAARTLPPQVLLPQAATGARGE